MEKTPSLRAESGIAIAFSTIPSTYHKDWTQRYCHKLIILTLHQKLNYWENKNLESNMEEYQG